MYNLEHLTLVEGLSLEIIETKLKEEKVSYIIEDDNPITFFREHYILINYHFDPKQKKTSSSEIIHLMGYPGRIHSRRLFYYAKYKVEEKFDFSKFDGKVTFERGLLVERTRIWCRYK